MTRKEVSVKIQPKKGSEEAFFAEQDQKKLRELRKKSPKKPQTSILKSTSTTVFDAAPKVWPKSMKAGSKLTSASMKIAVQFI